MTTTLPETSEILWDELRPPCEALLCKPKNPSELVAVHRHLELPVTCEEEGKYYLICRPCYDYIKTQKTDCKTCGFAASIYEV